MSNQFSLGCRTCLPLTVHHPLPLLPTSFSDRRVPNYGWKKKLPSEDIIDYFHYFILYIKPGTGMSRGGGRGETTLVSVLSTSLKTYQTPTANNVSRPVGRVRVLQAKTVFAVIDSFYDGNKPSAPLFPPYVCRLSP